MKHRLACLLLLCFLTPVRADEKFETAPAESADMQVLFSSKSNQGVSDEEATKALWKTWNGDPKFWTIKDGLIFGETTPEKVTNGNTFLILRGDNYKDFELRLSYRCNADNNSGIQYRSRHITDSSARNEWVVRGYQHELRNENVMPNVSGFIYDEGGQRRRICLAGEKAVWKDGEKQLKETLISPEEFKELFKLDDWNEVVIVAKGNHLKHYLNGRLILDFKDEDPKLALKEGIFALQLHAGKPMWVNFDNVRVKRIE